jgi:hypothetical protein
LEEEKSLSSDMPVQHINEARAKKGNLLKLEVQIDKKDIFEAEHVKLGDRLDKVCLKVSKSGPPDLSMTYVFSKAPNVVYDWNCIPLRAL